MTDTNFEETDPIEYSFVDIETELAKRKIISSLEGLDIYNNTITLIGGKSRTGKTSMCIHLSDQVVQSGQNVVYFDTDAHPTMNRPQPNLLRSFIEKNPDKYKKHFKYNTAFTENGVLWTIDRYKPALLIIDSIYEPFAIKYPKHPMNRAKQLKRFLSQIRAKIIEHQTAVVITTQLTKQTTDYGNLALYELLGGEGIKYASDTKWVLNFVGESGKKPAGSNSRRILNIDHQAEVNLKIDYGGKISVVGGRYEA